MSTKRTAILLFVALVTAYFPLAPMTVGGRGYIDEELASGMKMFEVFNAWWKARPIPAMVWSRHGVLGILFDLPLLKLGKFFLTPDFMLSMSPILFTAGLLVVLFLWLRKFASPSVSLLLTLAGAFGTMLWPYAYVGLETKQSFFVFLAGYLALAGGRIKSWPRLMVFAAMSGLALTVKSTGIVMWPAFAYLFYVQFRGGWRARLWQAAATAFVIGGVWELGAFSRRPFWAPLGGGFANIRGWLTDSPLLFFSNMIGVFGSPTKGLLVFAPILLVLLFAIPLALRARKELTVFALLVTFCTAGFISLLIVFADEVWGPRYMHVAIAPLILCIGAAWPRFEWRKYAPVVLLAVMGAAISFLGAFYYYGVRDGAMNEVGQNTLQWMAGDPTWSEFMFDARVFHVWKHGCPSTSWTPPHLWVWEPPVGAVPWKTLDLQKYCKPQSFFLSSWNDPLEGTNLWLRRACVVSLVVAVLALVGTLWLTARTNVAADYADFTD